MHLSLPYELQRPAWSRVSRSRAAAGSQIQLRGCSACGLVSWRCVARVLRGGTSVPTMLPKAWGADALTQLSAGATVYLGVGISNRKRVRLRRKR